MTKLKILISTFSSSLLLLLILCLGSQNLEGRHSLNLVLTKTEPLPAGFLIGISMVFGLMGGGAAAALIIPSENQFFDQR